MVRIHISGFAATNTTSGNISLTNGAALTINGITQTGGGNVNVTNTGTLTVGTAVSAAGAGTVSLTANGATSDILVNAGITSGSGSLSAIAGAL